MKILGIDHIGVAVKDAASALALYEGLLGLRAHGEETVPEQKVRTVFLPIGSTEIELLESTAEDGPVAGFIARRGEGVQHIALRVENIGEALAELAEKGVRLIDREPRRGAGGKRIAFLHPGDTHGVLIELCEG